MCIVFKNSVYLWRKERESGIINKKVLISALLLSVILCGVKVQAMTPQANSLYQQACSAEYKEDYKTAVEKLTEALTLSPNDVMIYTKLAGVYSEMGEYDNALEAYSKVAELKPTDGYIYVSVGSIYENQGKYNEALSAYNKVMEMCPEYLYNYFFVYYINLRVFNVSTSGFKCSE